MRTPARAAASPIRWATAPTRVTSVPSSRMNAAERKSARAPLIARSLTVPLTARSPMLPPGKNSGRTTKESVENARRDPPTSSTAESASCASEASAKLGRKTCSTSSPDMAPPPPCPITMVGLSRSGSGQVQPSKLGADPVRVSGSANGAHLPGVARGGQLHPPVEVVGGARALAGHHGRAEGVPRGAQGAERRALVRLDQALQHLAAAAHGGLLGVDVAHPEALLGVVLAVALGESPAALRDHPDAAPGAVDDLEDVLQHPDRDRVPLRGHGPGVGVLDLVPALLELVDGTPDSLQDVERLEAGHHDGDAEPLGERGVLAHPHDRADVAGREERLHPADRGGHDRLDRRRDADVADEQAEVLQAQLPGLVDRHRVRRRRRLEADAEEDDLPVGVLPCELQRVERGVHDPDVAAGALDAEEVLLAAGDPQHVAEGAEDHLWTRRDLERLVDHLERGDADRAAGAVDQLDAVGQQLVEAVPDDRVRLAAADLHHRPGLRDGGLDVVQQARGQRGVLELVEVLDSASPSRSALASRSACAASGRGRPACSAARPQWSPNSASSSPICRKISSVSSADCSSSRCSANPTCTIVYSPTWRSGTYSRQTSLVTPPKSTCAIRVPSRSVT